MGSKLLDQNQCLNHVHITSVWLRQYKDGRNQHKHPGRQAALGGQESREWQDFLSLLTAAWPCRGGRWGGHPAGDADRDLRAHPQARAEDQRGPRVPGAEGGEAHRGQETGECPLLCHGEGRAGQQSWAAPHCRLAHKCQRAETVTIVLCKVDLNSGVSMQMNFGFAVMGDMMMLGVLKPFIVKLYNSEISAF